MGVRHVAEDHVLDIQPQQSQLATDALAIVVVSRHADVLALEAHRRNCRQHRRRLPAAGDQVAADSHLRAGAVDLWRRGDAVDVVHRVGADGQDVPTSGSWSHGWSVAAESGMKKRPEAAPVSRLRPKRLAGGRRWRSGTASPCVPRTGISRDSRVSPGGIRSQQSQMSPVEHSSQVLHRQPFETRPPILVTRAPSSTLATRPMDSSRETPRPAEGSLAFPPH